MGINAAPTAGGEGFLTTTINSVANWGRKNSLWPMPFGTACCAIEMMGALASRFDLSRFGAEVARFSPRQADLMIVSGTITYKMAEKAAIAQKKQTQTPEPTRVVLHT